MPRCPVCDAPVVLDLNPAAPFCGERCRLVDLGRWLDEAYAVPDRRRAEDDEEEPAGDPPGDDEPP